MQGYGRFTASELAALRFGIRFPYAVCAVVAALGIATTSVEAVAGLAVIAFLGVVLPYHPLDYIYNHGLRQLLRRPKLPVRTPQTKFACMVATAWLAVTAILFWRGLLVAGVIWGGVLVALATLVSTTDICIPSMIYNLFIARKRRRE